MPLKILTLNIEGSVHLAKVTDLIKLEQPDVICLQEVFAADLPILEQATRCHLYHFPMVNITQPHQHQPEPKGEWGVAIGTPLKHTEPQALYYAGSAQIPENYTQPTDVSRVLAWLKLEEPSSQHWFQVATTHFTWSAKGQYTSLQADDFIVLSQQLHELGEVVLVGDLNSPRGGQSWANFASLLQDNIPADVTTTLDGQFHYAGQLELVVDGFFTSEDYLAHRVKVIGGVSDHMAVVGYVSRR